MKKGCQIVDYQLLKLSTENYIYSYYIKCNIIKHYQLCTVILNIKIDNTNN